MAKKKKQRKSEWTPALKVGAIALAFLIIGYQIALFVRQTALTTLEARRDVRDTVYIYVPAEGPAGLPEAVPPPAPAPAPPRAKRPAASAGAKAAVESFRFDPNTVSHADLMRLGFSDKQATAIEHYRQAGGHFARKEDFQRSFVVADSVYRRLEPFIDIPKLDLNAADSAALDALPGIGPYFAAKIIAYREELGGFSDPEQLLDIPRFEPERYEALKDLVTVGQ